MQSDPIGVDAGVNTYAYALSSPLAYIDPDGNEAIFKVIKLCAKGYIAIRDVGFKEAVRLARQGWSIKAPRKAEANKVANAVNGGATKPEFNKPHGDGFMPHYHPNPRTGAHIFYNVAAALTMTHYFEGCDCLMEKAAPIMDLVNPLSAPNDALEIWDLFQ